MGKSTSAPKAQFSLEGRFLKFGVEDGYKIKWMWLSTSTGEQRIKLSKAARATCLRVLSVGDWLRVAGEQKYDAATGAVKLKAYQVSPLVATGAVRSSSIALEALTQPPPSPPATKQGTILICQKPDCMRRGGQRVCQALAEALADRGLSASVTIKGTGCMKQCKAGPNLLVMPDKTRYRQATPREIPQLVEKHFSSATRQAPRELCRSLD